MANTVFPTKGNLIAAKKSLNLARLGFDLLDRKRNILIRELMQLTDKAKSLQGEIESSYQTAYAALQRANMTMGICDDISNSLPIENGVQIQYRSIMGVDIPQVQLDTTIDAVPFSLFSTNSQFDVAYLSFHRAKELTVVLAEVENSVYRLTDAIKKTQRRTNALKNISIPKYIATIRFITAALEEKDREEFSRLKVIRHTKEKAAKKVQ